MTDHEIVVLIHRLLDGTEWNADTLDAIAAVLEENGYPIRDLAWVPEDEQERLRSAGK